MPIYMDRHNVSETVTAEQIALIHQEDIKVQDQFGCRALTYWFDEKRRIAFCLIEGPDAKSIQQMHDHAHGQVAHEVIEVDAAIVESFLGRIEDPKNTFHSAINIINDTPFRTIMVIVLKRLSLLQNDSNIKTSLHRYNKSVLKILNSYEGAVVKQATDHFLISFKSVINAISAALAIRSLFHDFRTDINNNKICLKIGLNAGVPVTKKKLIFEDTIKLAERMCKIVKGEIIISNAVKELFDSENVMPLDDVQEQLFFLTTSDEKFINLLMDYTEAAWSNTNFKVDDFSKPVGCSKSQLYRKIISLTGKSPNAFIKDYRLDEALTLLNKHTGNVSEIAFETGFSSPSYFTKCFQKTFGHSPSDYLPR